MFGTRWQLFRLFGIPIYLDLSWLVILALLTLTVSENLPVLVRQSYPGAANRLMPWEYWLAGFLAALGFFVCLILHELGHAVAARSENMPTKGITLFLFGGVAELGDEPPSAWSEFVTAVAGPAVTVVLMVTLGVLTSIGFHQGWHPVLVVALGYLGAINAMVLVFNLIPAYPLDGGRVLRSLLWGASGSVRRATRWAAGIGRFIAWLMIAWGILQFFTGNWISGIWLGLIGWFLSNAAQSGYAQVVMRQALQGEPVRRFMTREPISVPETLSLREWVEEYIYRYHRKVFPVIADGRLVGFIATSDLARVPRSEWEFHTVSEVMRTDLTPITIRPDTDAITALTQMQQIGAARLLVVEDDRLVGILTLKDLLRFLSLKLELDEEHPQEEGRTPIRGVPEPGSASSV